IDTAGIRKKSKIDEDVEYYGFVRSLRSIDRASVCLLLIDATIGLTDLDQRVAQIAKDRYCAMIILINKWDLLTDATARQELLDRINDRMLHVQYAPYLCISAKTGKSTQKIWDLVNKVYENYNQKIPTNRLNFLLARLREFGNFPVKGTRALKINYVTQTRICPPGFTYFVNFPQIIDANFERFLENKMRETFDLEGTPIVIKFKKKN
ncbi:MAG: GTP-binding protein, partial [Coriobacteriales bacterium]|nr:GTP-binding protein [Coriobacteriales bacterium]